MVVLVRGVQGEKLETQMSALTSPNETGGIGSAFGRAFSFVSFGMHMPGPLPTLTRSAVTPQGSHSVPQHRLAAPPCSLLHCLPQQTLQFHHGVTGR